MLIKYYEKIGKNITFEGYINSNAISFIVDRSPIKIEKKEYYKIKFIGVNETELKIGFHYINKKDFKHLRRIK